MNSIGAALVNDIVLYAHVYKPGLNDKKNQNADLQPTDNRRLITRLFTYLYVILYTGSLVCSIRVY